jgi:hypothetical protein
VTVLPRALARSSSWHVRPRPSRRRAPADYVRNGGGLLLAAGPRDARALGRVRRRCPHQASSGRVWSSLARRVRHAPPALALFAERPGALRTRGSPAPRSSRDGQERGAGAVRLASRRWWWAHARDASRCSPRMSRTDGTIWRCSRRSCRCGQLVAWIGGASRSPGPPRGTVVAGGRRPARRRHAAGGGGHRKRVSR